MGSDGGKEEEDEEHHQQQSSLLSGQRVFFPPLAIVVYANNHKKTSLERRCWLFAYRAACWLQLLGENSNFCCCQIRVRRRQVFAYFMRHEERSHF